MSNYSNWEKQFDSQIGLSITASEATFKEAGQELLKRIQERTPVGDPTLWKWPAHADYVPGTLKASWTSTIEDNTINIENSTPYAYRVEYGSWSTQAPAGMMRISLLEWPTILAQSSKRNRK